MIIKPSNLVFSACKNGVFTDSVGDLSATNIGSVDTTTGSVGLAAQFGTGKALHYGDSLDSTISGANKKFSISCIFKATTINGSGVNAIAAKYADSVFSENNRGIALVIRLGKIAIVTTHNDLIAYTLCVLDADTITANKVYHVIWSYDGTVSTVAARSTLYLNGVLLTLNTVYDDTVNYANKDIPNGTAKFAIGGYVASNGTSTINNFVGWIQRVSVWNTGMTQKEAAILYHSTKGAYLL